MTLEYGLTSEQAHINLHEFNRNEVSRSSSVWKVCLVLSSTLKETLAILNTVEETRVRENWKAVAKSTQFFRNHLSET